VRLVQRRERGKALECVERLRVYPHRSRVLESSVNDAVPDAHQTMTRKLLLHEVTEILDGGVVTEGHSAP
jgi:hypothetical protein